MAQSLQYPTTSLQYTFGNTDVDLIIRDAFQRCGIENFQQAGISLQSARSSLDFLFSHWINRGLNLFTVVQYIIPIVNYQYVYSLPLNTSKILEGILMSSTSMTGGTASSSAGGTPSVCFTYPYGGTPCTQTSADGNISYLYTSANAIMLVGIETATTAIYKISIDCSFLSSPSEGDWINILNTPQQPYYYGLPIWFSLPTTQTAVNWRIRETGGATLNIAQIMFDIPSDSQPMEPESRTEYTKQTINASGGSVQSTYWHNRINPTVVRIYGTPINSQYDFFVFNCVRYIQDCGDFQNSVDANSRFIEPATAGLAAKLAEKYAPDRYINLIQAAEKVYMEAGREDTENVPSRAQFSLTGGFA